jgi:hypothetical protein
MELHGKDHHLDQWLEKALREYGNAEPRAGLENRILANLESAQNTSLSRISLWRAFAVPALAACVILAIWIGSSINRAPRKTATISKSPMQSLTSASRETPEVPRESVHAEPRRPKGHPWPPQFEVTKEPRLQQFPSPERLTVQEQLLARYARNFPQDARIVADEQTRAEAKKQLEELAMDKALDSNSDQKER